MAKKWISTREAADRLGITPQAVRDRIKRGEYKADREMDPKTRRWQYMVDASSLPSDEELTKITQTLHITDEQLEGIVKGLTSEALAEVKPALTDMAEQLSECQSMLHKLLEENTVETRELREKVEAYEEQARKRSWWRILLGGGPGSDSES